MKTRLIQTVLAATLFAAPSAVLAQAAAGSVPDAFDAAPRAAAATPAPAPAPVQGEAPDIARAEVALRDVIAAVQGAGFDYSVFTPDLAARMRQLSPEISPLIKSFGAVRKVEFQKAEGEAQLFRVTFDNRVTEWMILFDPEDRIAGLRFRPVDD